jgi:hypothetical protein
MRPWRRPTALRAVCGRAAASGLPFAGPLERIPLIFAAGGYHAAIALILRSDEPASIGPGAWPRGQGALLSGARWVWGTTSFCPTAKGIYRR